MDQQMMRKKLLYELEELMGKAERMDKHLHNDDAPPKDWEELATYRENDEVIEALDGMAHHRINEIKHTISRMDAGEWEICSECDEPINEQRLLAIPTVTTCITCAEKLEH